MQVPIPDVSSKSLSELVSLTGRRAVVTGAGRGLGRAVAERLSEAGAKVLVADIEHKLAAAVAENLNARRPGCALAAHLDVTDGGSIVAAAELAVREFGGLDIWVNNAGIFPSVPALEMSEQTWDEVFAVNTRGVFLGSREAARRMSEAGSGGVIVNVVSTAGFRGRPPGLPPTSVPSTRRAASPGNSPWNSPRSASACWASRRRSCRPRGTWRQPRRPGSPWIPKRSCP